MMFLNRSVAALGINAEFDHCDVLTYKAVRLVMHITNPARCKRAEVGNVI